MNLLNLFGWWGFEGTIYKLKIHRGNKEKKEKEKKS